MVCVRRKEGGGGKQNIVTLWSLANYRGQCVLKILLQKIEKQVMVYPPLITITIMGSTDFITAPQVIQILPAKITIGGKHSPVSLQLPVTVIC